jgi:hypothetical protein
MNSKNKGNTFERKVSNLLSDRFLDITGIAKSFRRNADSGSFFGGGNKTRTETHDTSKATFGDIIVPEGFAFSIECKHYKDPPSFSSLVKQEVAALDKWITQAEQDGESSGKLPCIIVKYNNVPEVVLIKNLFGSLTPIARYKTYHIVPLADFLAQEDVWFFPTSSA